MLFEILETKHTCLLETKGCFLGEERFFLSFGHFLTYIFVLLPGNEPDSSYVSFNK